MSKKFYALSMLFFFLAAFFLALFSFKFLQNKEKKQIPVVRMHTIALNAEPLKPKDTLYTQKYIGYVIPINEAVVQPYISGFIEKIYVKGGETVKAGDVLVVLQQDEYLAALKAAYADILKAEAAYQNAETYFARMQKAGKSVSSSQLEDAEASYLSSAATLEAAKANYQTAQVNYEYTLIRAPIDGVVGDVRLTKGNYVSPSTGALLNIVQYNPIRVVFSVSDRQYLSELKKQKPFDNETLKLELPDGKIFKNTGVFQYTDNVIDKKTTSVSVYADFKNIGKILTPNTYVTVYAEDRLKNTITVAKNLVVLENTGNFLYLIRNQKLIKEKVEILATVGEDFILKNTFQKGDAVVTDRVNEKDLGLSVEMITKQKKA